jgi:hypothetical protein
MQRRRFVACGAASLAGALFGKGIPEASGQGARLNGGGREGSLPVFLHYMNWYAPSTWDQASQIPLIGRYDSRNVDLMRLHDKTARQQGLGWLWSYWGEECVFGCDGSLSAYLAATSGSTVKLIILFEGQGILAGNYDFDQQSVRQRFVEAVRHLQTAHFSDPAEGNRFYRINGKPVLFFWNLLAFTGDFKGAVDEARRAAGDLYLVGGLFSLETMAPPNLETLIDALDAVSGYGAYNPYFTLQFGNRLNRSYLDQYERAVLVWRDRLLGYRNRTGRQVAFILPFTLAFDDILVRPEARNPPLMSTPEEAHAFLAGVHSMVESGINVPDPLIRPEVFGVSWNEHLEGTGIEPTLEHGDAYLAALQEELARPFLLRPLSR